MARDEAGITWDWAEAGRGALCALPAAVVIPAVSVTLGMVFAVVTLPVAMLGVPPQRSKRPRLGLIGLALAVSYALGSVVGLQHVARVAAERARRASRMTILPRRPIGG